MSNDLEELMKEAQEKFFPESGSEDSPDIEAEEGGKDALENNSEENDAEESTESDQQSPKPEAVADEPPEHWASEHKEKYRSLKTEEERANFRDMDKFFHQMHKRRMEEAVQPFKQVFEPYRQELAQRNMTEVDAIKAMISDQNYYRQFQEQMEKNPVSVLEKLAERHGVSAFFDKDDSAAENTPKYSLPEEVRQKLEKIDYLESQITQSQQNNALSIISEFENERDASGNLLHPHYEKLYPNIIDYVKLQRANGRSPDKALLKEAYEYSVNADPELRRAEIDRQVQAELAKANKERDVAKAKQAGRKLNGSAGASAIKPTDLNSVMEMANKHFYGS